MNESLVFFPPHRLGLITHIIGILAAIAVGFLGLWQAAGAEIGLSFLLYLIPILIALVMNVQASRVSKKPYLDQGNMSWSVYNNSGVQLDKGSPVVWDDTTSYKDNSAVTTASDSADGYKFAGIVRDTIDTGDVGIIIVYGWAEVNIAAGQSDTTSTDLMLQLSSTAGAADLVDTSVVVHPEAKPIGFLYEAIGSNAAAEVTCFIKGLGF